jgi:hypothetical protein
LFQVLALRHKFSRENTLFNTMRAACDSRVMPSLVLWGEHIVATDEGCVRFADDVQEVRS